MKKLFLTLLFFTLISPACFARFASNLNESYLLITVKNETPDTCQLDDANPIHGPDLSVLRPTLPSGHSADFVIFHPWSNANYIIAYRCGNEKDGYKRVSFVSKRNFGFWWAGYTRGKFLPEESSPGITAIVTRKRRGSVDIYFHRNGFVEWSIRYY